MIFQEDVYSDFCAFHHYDDDFRPSFVGSPPSPIRLPPFSPHLENHADCLTRTLPPSLIHLPAEDFKVGAFFPCLPRR